MIYTIPEGKHYPKGLRFSPFLRRPRQEYIVRFDESCRYNIGPDQADWNKVFGQTHGLASNSSRWASRYVIASDVVQITPYMHKSGEILYDGPIFHIPIGQPLTLGIVPLEKHILFTRNGKTVYLWTPPTNAGWGYRQFPYQGGNVPATHETRIELLDLT